MSGLRRIRRAIRERRVAFSDHALEEMDDEALTLSDVRKALTHGAIHRTIEDDPRGVRYVLRHTLDAGKDIEVVCRFLASGQLWVITVYLVKEQSDG